MTGVQWSPLQLLCKLHHVCCRYQCWLCPMPFSTRSLPLLAKCCLHGTCCFSKCPSSQLLGSPIVMGALGYGVYGRQISVSRLERHQVLKYFAETKGSGDSSILAAVEEHFSSWPRAAMGIAYYRSCSLLHSHFRHNIGCPLLFFFVIIYYIVTRSKASRWFAFESIFVGKHTS